MCRSHPEFFGWLHPQTWLPLTQSFASAGKSNKAEKTSTSMMTSTKPSAIARTFGYAGEGRREVWCIYQDWSAKPLKWWLILILGKNDLMWVLIDWHWLVSRSQCNYTPSPTLTTPILWDPKNEPIQYASMSRHYMPIVYCKLQVKLWSLLSG